MAASFATLSDEVVRGIFAFQPAIAQNAGDHQFDGQTGDFSPDAVRQRIDVLTLQQAELRAASVADVATEADRLTLLAQVDAWLGKLRDRAEHRHNPMFYFGRYGIGDVGRYIRRDYAPVAERAESLIAHLDALTPAVHLIDETLEQEIAGAQRTVALDEVRRYPSFYRTDVLTQIGKDVSAAQRHRLEQACDGAAQAMEWLADRLAAPADNPGLRFNASARRALARLPLHHRRQHALHGHDARRSDAIIRRTRLSARGRRAA
jgi:hypothetical protein